MFIRKRTLTCLDSWIDGYMAWVVWQYELDSPEYKELPFNGKNFWKFQEYIQKKMGDSKHVSIELILNYCNWDDEKAFDMYFELFDEFLKIEKIPLILPTDK